MALELRGCGQRAAVVGKAGYGAQKPDNETRQMRRPARPGDYCPHCRDDRRPILGDTEAERRERLVRLRGALVAAGMGEVEGNRRAHRAYGVVGIELLTAAEADAMIAALGER